MVGSRVDHNLLIEPRHVVLFWDKTTPGPYSVKCRSNCIDWTGATVDGYARFKIYGTGNRYRVFRGHIFSYTVKRSAIPLGHELSHMCQRRICVNDRHLQPLRRRAHFAYDNHPSHQKSQQTHCLHGHEFNEANTRFNPNGTRICKPCKAARDKLRKSRTLQSSAVMRRPGE